MIRLLDVILSICGLVCTLPILLLLLLVGVFDTGSPLFIQIRVGRNQKEFYLVKFRTMKIGTPSVATHLAQQNSTTSFGSFLRKTKLDELPQLWNVLIGEMSLVGPRPNLHNQIELIQKRDSLGVYKVRPGITGLAQVSEIDMSMPELLAKTDAEMIKTLTVGSYLKYILLTITGKGSGDRIRPNLSIPKNNQKFNLTQVNNITFAVVGFGHIGRRHATIINGYPECELVAIVETDSSALKSDLYPVSVPHFRTLEEMYQSGIHPDVVNIAAPNGLHCELALVALKNKSHAVIEKPMGLSKTECEEVIFTSLQMSRQVFVVKQNRYSPPSKWLKEVVSNKIIGDTLMVQVNCYWNRDDRYYKPGGWKGTKKMDGGTLFTQFSHFVDIMYWVFGDIKNIKANFHDFTHKHNTEFEDSGLVQFEFVNGGMGSLNFSTSVWDTNLESSITVIGTKGSIKVGGQYMNEIEYCHIDNYIMPELPPTNPPNDYGPFKGSAANHHYVIENVVNTLNGTDTITANALEGMKVVDIIERIYQSQG